MLKFVFCEHCVSHLIKKGELACDLYEHICLEYIAKGFCEVTNTEIVKYLESQNYIISTDVFTDENVYVKPANIENWQVYDTHLICSSRGNHV